MPAISFQVMKDKLISGEKKQTIRPKRSGYWLRFKRGERLVGYWKQRTPDRERLFDSKLSEDPFVVKWKDFADELMVMDGFPSLETANREWFIPRYGKGGEIIPNMEFVVIRWV